MPQHYAGGAGADGRGRQGVVQLLDAQHLRPYHPDGAGQQDDQQGDDDIVGGTAQDGDQRQRQDDGRKGHHRVHDALDSQVNYAAHIGADDANQCAQRYADAHAEQADINGNLRTGDNPAELVAVQMVTAQPGAAAGRQSFLRVGAHIQRVVGQQARRSVGNRRRQNGQQNDGGAYRAQGLGAAKTDYFLRPGLAGTHFLQYRVIAFPIQRARGGVRGSHSVNAPHEAKAAAGPSRRTGCADPAVRTASQPAG